MCGLRVIKRIEQNNDLEDLETRVRKGLFAFPKRFTNTTIRCVFESLGPLMKDVGVKEKGKIILGDKNSVSETTLKLPV